MASCAAGKFGAPARRRRRCMIHVDERISSAARAGCWRPAMGTRAMRRWGGDHGESSDGRNVVLT